MKSYLAVVLLLQCFVVSLKTETINPVNTTKETWREILPDYCGLRHHRLLEKMDELNITRPSVTNDVTKVIGGEHTTIADHPWQVAIIERHDKFLKCGGSIISKYHVLTAAHCLIINTTEIINHVTYISTSAVFYESLQVAVGKTVYSESKLLYNISEAYIHDFHSYSHFRNDIALIKIDGEFVWSEFVWPICLPDENESYNLQRQCQISGFGRGGKSNPNGDGYILAGIVSLKTEAVCNQTKKESSIKITEGMFCASGQLKRGVVVDSCQGDSGGPLDCEHIDGQKQVLLGITSFGYGCGLEHYPGIYTQVSKYLQWIHGRLDVSSGYDAMDNLPEDDDVGRPAYVSVEV